MTLVNPTKSPKMSEINNGSKVEVQDVTNGVDTFTGIVVGSTSAFGPTRLPAIYVKVDGTEDNVVAVSDTGKWRVRVLVDSALLGSDAVPESAVYIRNKPVTKQAVQFVGGAKSASEIIQWAAARAAISWRQSTSDTSEALILHTPEGAVEVPIGNWVVCGSRGEFYTDAPEVFVEQYDIVDAAQAGPMPTAQKVLDEARREREIITAAAQQAMMQGHAQTQPSPFAGA